MATSVVFNGVNYSVPAFGDVGYAQGPGNLSSYLVALASGTLQNTGGLFSLTSDANFGPNFGLVSIYFKSASANIAQSGVLRLANTDFIAWRNFANSADLPLAVNVSDQLTYNGVVISTAAAGGTVNPGIAGRLTLYPAAGNTVDDVYVQNAQNIDVLIATQAARSVPLQYTIPNPGNAVAAATFALLELAQTFTAAQTFATANVTGLLTAANIDITSTLELVAGATVIFDGVTSGAITMKAPAIVTTPYTFTLPPNPGTSGYFMQTDGVGVTTWAPAGGVGTFEYVAYIVGTPSGTYSGSTTVFSLPFTYVTDGKHIEVFYNGQQLKFPADYTETSSTQVTTTTPLLAGQSVWFRTVTGGIVAPATVTLLREDYIVGTPSGTYTGSTTVFNLGNTYTVGGNVLIATIDGDVQTKGASADYLETNSNTVTFNFALVVGERVSFIWSQTVGVSAGIVNAGTINQFAFYPATSSAVSGTPTLTTTGSVNTSTVPLAMSANKITGLANGTVSTDAAAFGQLKIVQIISSTTASSTTTTSSTYQNTNIVANITPTSASNKVLVLVQAGCQAAVVGNVMKVALFGGGTGVGGFQFASFQPPASATMRGAISAAYLDSPASTSPQTYTVKILSGDNVNSVIIITGAGETASIILMEVVA